MQMLVAAPVMTDMNTPGGGDAYGELPNRLDALVVRVPARPGG